MPIAHRHAEWLKFLRLIDKSVPADLEIHLIADNYRTHKHDKVQRWLARHKRFHMHFTPTSASWLNMVERFFRDLTTKRIRRGTFASIDQLIAAIGDYILHHNADPRRGPVLVSRGDKQGNTVDFLLTAKPDPRARPSRGQAHHAPNTRLQGYPLCADHSTGVELMHMIRKGQMRDDGRGLSAVQQFYVLA